MDERQAALALRVRELIEENPERHTQGCWIGNRWTSGTMRNLASRVAALAGQPMPEEPADRENPVCMTTGCVAGWASILSAPRGAWLVGDLLWLPTPRTRGARGRGAQPPTDSELSALYEAQTVSGYAAGKLGLTVPQQEYLFSERRTREEVLSALEYLPDHPGATLQDLISACGDEECEYADDDFEED